MLARRLRRLQAVPIIFNEQQVVYVDLRESLAHDLLAGSPWKTAPWENDEQQVMRRVVARGDVAFDIGAHFGLHTVLLAELVGPRGRVEAFEPNQMLLAPLRLTASEAGNVRVHPFGLADRTSQRPFYVPNDRSMASLADWTKGRGGQVSTTTCELRALDDLIDSGIVSMPDFIKCDVEGAEALAFLGARRTLDRVNAPILLYEANNPASRALGFSGDTATEWLRRLDAPQYSIFHVQPQGVLTPLVQLDPTGDYYNLLAVPRAKLDRAAHGVAS
jgi:FkbM family methyltransferase